MPEVPSLESSEAAASFSKTLWEQLKSIQAPYGSASTVGAIIISFALASGLSIEKQRMIIYPIYLFLFALAILAFFSEPVSQKSLENNRDAVEADIDSQLKLARSTGLSVGMICMFFIAEGRNETDAAYLLLWSIVLFHCSVYVIYMVSCRLATEESYENRAYFQLSFLTSLFLYLLCFSGISLPTANNHYLRSCNMRVDFITVAGYNNRDAAIPPPVPHTETVDICTHYSGRPEGIADEDLIDIIAKTPGDYYDKPDTIAIVKRWPVNYFVSMHSISFVLSGILWMIFILFWTSKIVGVFRRSKLSVTQ